MSVINFTIKTTLVTRTDDFRFMQPMEPDIVAYVIYKPFVWVKYFKIKLALFWRENVSLHCVGSQVSA
jgi:hypothetical protein